MGKDELMRKTFTLLTMVFLFTGARLNAEPAQSARRVDLQPMAFVTYIHYPYQEDAAAMLVDSIRAWGGEYRECPIYAVLTDPRASGLRLKDKNVQLVPLELDESVRNYPFAAKAYAAAKVESLIAGKAQSLAWFDPETMLLRPPREMDLKDGVSAAVAPVAFINIGQAENEPVNAYWAAIYKKCSLDPKKLFIVETKVDCKKVRAWLNCGMFAVRADRGLCREWAQVLDELLHDKEYQRTAITDAVHKTFLHQAVISTLIVSRLDRREIHMFSPGYNYPLYCHDIDFEVANGTYRMPAHKKARKLNDLTSVFIESFFIQHPDWIRYVPPVDGPLRKWLTEEVILSMSASRTSALEGADKYDLSKVEAGQGWKVVNRGVTAFEDGGRKAARFDERAGQGLAWLEGVTFAEGTIEFDVRGRDAEQKSFVGVAFHGADDQTFEAVYFRPFNFKSADAAKAGHAVQYVSHPEFTWQKLRAERPGQFEQTVRPVPDPNGWFHVRIVIASTKVSVYVDSSPEPCLAVDKLGGRQEGMIGLFAGNGSGGDFADLKIVSTKGDN
jgi:hypothetical protein